MLREICIGAIAGAAGTATLNTVTNLDMVVRGRPSSGVPATVAGKMADSAGIEPLSIQNQSDTAQNRQSGAGALLGILVGVGIGALYGAIRPHASDVPTPVMGVSIGAAAMAGSDVPATAFGVTDPRTWSASSWLSDVIPHLLYGLVTAAVYDMLTRGR